MSILKEFREFAIKGNFIDLAVGVIIGAASGDVVKAIVDKVVMPPIGLVTGRVNFTQLRVVLQPGGPIGADGKANPPEVAIGYGDALQTFIQFLIIAFIVFLIVRAYNKFRHQATPEATATEKLLTEIRDTLKAQAPAKVEEKKTV